MTVKIDGVEPNIFPDVEDLDARDAGRNVEVFLDIRVKGNSSATAEVLLPALDTPCHSPMRSVPDRSIHQSRQGKAPRSIQGASLPLRHGSSRSCEGITPTLQSDRPFPHKRDGIVCLEGLSSANLGTK